MRALRWTTRAATSIAAKLRSGRWRRHSWTNALSGSPAVPSTRIAYRKVSQRIDRKASCILLSSFLGRRHERGREYALLPVADDVGQSSIGWSSAAVMDLRTRARPGASTLVGHSSQLLGRLTGTPCGSVWFSCHREVRALGGRTEMRIDYVLKRV